MSFKRILVSGMVAVVLFVTLCSAHRSDSAVRVPTRAIAMPFDFYHHEVVIQVMLNGHGPFAMLLDTGTDPSVVDLSLAHRLGLPMASTGQAGSGGGTEKTLAYATTLENVRLGEFSAVHISALALDLSSLSSRFGRPIQGVLGQSLLEGHIVQFDYPARIVRFLPSNNIANDKLRRNTFSFHDEESIVINGVTINSKRATANIDTGSNSGFQITPIAIRNLGLTSQAHHAKGSVAAGFNGSYQNRVGTVDHITIGSISLRHPKVTFWMPDTGHDSTVWDINIGNVFLQDYIVTFDYIGKRVTFEPSHNPPSHHSH